LSYFCIEFVVQSEVMTHHITHTHVSYVSHINVNSMWKTKQIVNHLHWKSPYQRWKYMCFRFPGLFFSRRVELVLPRVYVVQGRSKIGSFLFGVRFRWWCPKSGGEVSTSGRINRCIAVGRGEITCCPGNKFLMAIHHSPWSAPNWVGGWGKRWYIGVLTIIYFGLW